MIQSTAACKSEESEHKRRAAMPYKTALLVDDDPIMREVGCAALRSLGAQGVESASSGTEALKKLDELDHKVDLIISDLQMPGMDGMALLRALSEVNYKGAIVILSSMESSVLSLSTSLAAQHGLNVLGHLSKPFNQRLLSGLLTPAIAGSSQPTADLSQVSPVHAERLQNAISVGHIQPYFQSKFCLRTRQIVGAEALARWIDPVCGVIPPNKFIDLAEENGLIASLTTSVLRQSLAQTAMIRPAAPEFRVAVNLSANLFEDLSLPDRIMAELQKMELAPDALVLELTETRLLSSSAKAKEVFGRLRLFGIELSIDDFGTGTANFDTLCTYPFTELKIDGSFVAAAPSDAVARRVVSSSIELAREMGLRVVAEGIETHEQAALVSNLGVEHGQGFLFARPQSELAVQPSASAVSG